ncbi:MAG: bifunctional acetate--CoA ligase family protein/GNAT family N-acetyltransferase [Simkaniaceae bacterium]|nr:bifunctional acetate--CoA ligase family protein/GNAT family N-acetyltransferase [Candidatus Sacchlamyda saccharinae]
MDKKIKVDPSHAFLRLPAHPMEPFFQPKSIVVIGATKTASTVGNTLMQNLVSGGFEGDIYPVNPKYDTLFDLKCYPSVDAIEGSIDLAVIITPAKTVPGIIDQCVAKQVKGAIIISAGFKELGPEGLELENEVLKRARAGNLRIVGPNCLGIMNPLAGYNATFAASMALKGNIAFISQSGAMCTAVLDWSLKQKIGFSAFVSIGSMADVNWGDLIDYLGNDPNTSSILIYMESIGDAKDFLSAAREVALNKPIIVIKAGRTEAAAKAAASHTGSMAGSDDVFEAAMKRAGVLRVLEIGDLFDMAEVLAKQPLPKGPNLTILTNAGGPAVLATDSAAHYGAEIADLAPETIEALNAFLPAAWSHANPVDLLGDAGPDRYAKAIEIVAKDPNTDGILAILSPQDMTDVLGTAECLKPYANIGKPILASWMGGEVVEKGTEVLSSANIPTFVYPDSASKTFADMWRQNYALQMLYETPEIREDITGIHNRMEKTEAIIQKALKEGRDLLTEEESKQVLLAYSIPTVQTIIATSPDEAATAADEMNYPVVLKLHSETITHKSDVGGVILNLKDAASVKKAFDQIKTSVAEKAGAEHFLGVTVQKMISLDGYEIILGSSLDPQFGPVILFGTGGQLVEVYKDRALGLPPLNANLARRLMSQTKIYEALQGVRGRGAVDFVKLEQILISFSELIVSHPHITECDINPLLASSDELIALDARIVLSKEPVAHPVIRPYPSQYISTATLKDGTELLLRPVRPEDEPLFMDFHQQLSEETVKARYFEELTLEERTAHERLIRIAHADYDREILLLAIQDISIVGAIRLSKIPLTNTATIKLVLIDKIQKQGLGTILLNQILDIAKLEGITEIHVQILSNNIAMKKMLKRAGFILSPSEENPDIINASLAI